MNLNRLLTARNMLLPACSVSKISVQRHARKSLASGPALCLTAMLLFLAASASAQAPAAGSNWDHLKALPAQTRLHVAADKGGSTCKLVSVDDATLVCGKKTFQRADVKSVKLTRYGTSYTVGAAVGGGVGVGIGLAVIRDTFVEDKKGEAAGIGLGIGAALGALVAGPADLFRGPTVYRRQ